MAVRIEGCALSRLVPKPREQVSSNSETLGEANRLLATKKSNCDCSESGKRGQCGGKVFFMSFAQGLGGERRVR